MQPAMAVERYEALGNLPGDPERRGPIESSLTVKERAECAAWETGHHEVVWYFSKLCIEDRDQMGMRNFLAD